MQKRLTFLRRRPDLSPESFRQHWSGTHGEIAAGFAGLARYHQNHVRTRLAPGTPTGYFLDGIVELWFDDAAGATPGRDPDVSARLIADEPRFLDGLTGFAVAAPPPGAASPEVAWVLAHTAEADAAQRIESAALDLEHAFPELIAVETNVPSPGTRAFTRAFTRAALAVDPAPPNVAIAFRFGEHRPSPSDLALITEWAERVDIGLTDIETVAADEIRIV